MASNKIVLVYDKECPLCDMYCRLVRIRENAGELLIINARDSTEVMQEITDQGLDIDQGMVLKMNNVLYYGADAIHVLSMISSRSGFFNRVNFWIFRSRIASRILYPLLRAGRNLLLKMLRKSKINNLGKADNSRF